MGCVRAIILCQIFAFRNLSEGTRSVNAEVQMSDPVKHVKQSKLCLL